MSLKQEERDIMVALEMEKADCTFAEHEGLTEKGLLEQSGQQTLLRPVSRSERHAHL